MTLITVATERSWRGLRVDSRLRGNGKRGRGLAEKEGADGVGIVEEGGGLFYGVGDGSFEGVDAEAFAVGVHHQAEGGGRAGIAGDGDGDDAVVLEEKEAGGDGDFRGGEGGLAGAGVVEDYFGEIFGGEGDAGAGLVDGGAEAGLEFLVEGAGEGGGALDGLGVEGFHAADHGDVVAGLGFEAKLEGLGGDLLH